ncbi:MAG: hypothetical protein U1E27_12805 [Kiritimatiellia bacterium]|nr:hypothetical protein [Kiritimatiellia bacterium]
MPNLPAFLRDITFLRDEWGAPIDYDASKKGCYLSDHSILSPSNGLLDVLTREEAIIKFRYADISTTVTQA